MPRVKNTSKSPGRFKRSSVRGKLFFAIGLPVVVLVIALSILAWLGARREVAQSLERELTSVVEVAANSIHPQSVRFLLPDDPGTRTYKKLLVKLKAIQKTTGSVRVLLLGGDEKVRVDASEKIGLFETAPRVAIDRTEFEEAIKSERAQVSVPFEGLDGKRYMAAYAKVPEKQDLLGDIDADTPREPIVLAIEAPTEALDATDRLASYLFGICLLAILFVFAIAVVVANSITSPLMRLASDAEKLGRGQLDELLEIPDGKDEVAVLGHTLEDMRGALKSRDQERQMMLAGIAHEVRNPLGGMELFSGLLEESIDELPTGDITLSESVKDDLRSHASRVRRELRYLTGVVNDFLAFARDLPAAREHVNLKKLVAEVDSLTNKNDTWLHTDLAGAPNTFALDKGRVKEALINLVNNARQASSDEGKVYLRAFSDGDGLVFEVQDSGKGMSAETLEQVFTPFYTTREKGSGLGLPLVKKFARDHNGDATIVSELEKGTTVSFRLGAAPESSVVEHEPSLLGDSNTMHSQEGEPLLLGDDEPAMLGDA